MRFNSHDLLGVSLTGRYELRRIIKAGGMGTVYSAYDARLRRPVAVKVVVPSPAWSPERRARLRRRLREEAMLVASLPLHDNLVPVYDYRTDRTLDVDFIVMEHVNGADLGTLLERRKRLPVDAALRITVEIAAALEVGHAHGLIHLDVKPGNVVLHVPSEAARSPERARLIDFGIAALLGTEYRRGARIPHTPEYASPEQLEGGREITPASDVFSVGIVLCEMLTGERPFSGTDREEANLAPLRDTLAHIAGGSELDRLVVRMLNPQPESRFRNGAELRSALLSLPATIRACEAPTGGIVVPGEDETLESIVGTRATLSLAVRT